MAIRLTTEPRPLTPEQLAKRSRLSAALAAFLAGVAVALAVSFTAYDLGYDAANRDLDTACQTFGARAALETNGRPWTWTRDGLYCYSTPPGAPGE